MHLHEVLAAACTVGAGLLVYALMQFYRLARRKESVVLLVEGNIAVGKTTAVTAMRAEHDVVVAPEAIGDKFLAAFYADPKRYAFALQMTQDMTRQSLVKWALGEPSTHVILDRSVLGGFAFALWQRAIGNFSERDWQLYREQFGTSVDEVLEKAGVAADRCIIVFLHDAAGRCSDRQRIRDSSDIQTSYLLGLETTHLIVMSKVPRRYRLVEMRWQEYAETSMTIAACESPSSLVMSRRESLHRRAYASMHANVYNTEARCFLKQFYEAS